MKQRDYLKWNEVELIINLLIKDERFLMGLFVLIGCMTGMRAKDILALHWNEVKQGSIFFKETSTGRYYVAALTDEAKEYIARIYEGAGAPSLNSYCFISKKKRVYSIQRINILLKQISTDYLGGQVLFTTTTLRRTFGREYLKHFGACLNSLRMFFNQDSEEFTANYLRLYNRAYITLPKLCTITQKYNSHD